VRVPEPPGSGPSVSLHRPGACRRAPEPEGGSRLLHASQEVEFQPYEAKLEALVQESLGSVRLPNDVLFTPVPDLQVGNTGSGKARLLHCLFTDDFW
jgi:hypothetical protein